MKNINFFLIMITVIVGIAFAFPKILEWIYPFVPSRFGSKDSWIGFLGGYLGSIIAVLGIWWQMNVTRKQQIIDKELGAINILNNILKIFQEELKNIKVTLIDYSTTNRILYYSNEDLGSYLVTDEIKNIYIEMVNRLSEKKYSIELLSVLNVITVIDKITQKNYLYSNLKSKTIDEIYNFVNNSKEIEDKKKYIDLIKAIGENSSEIQKFLNSDVKLEGVFNEIKKMIENLNILVNMVLSDNNFKDYKKYDLILLRTYNVEIYEIVNNENTEFVRNINNLNNKIESIINEFKKDKKRLKYNIKWL